MTEHRQDGNDRKYEPLDEYMRRTPDWPGAKAPCTARWELTVHGVRQTHQLAALLGQAVGPGAVITLDGDLGAGKTTFVRGLAEGMGLDADVVTSPTFTLIHEYNGPVPLYHFDVYRLKVPEEFFGLGAEEYLYGDGVCAIEWGANVRAELPAERLEIELRVADGDQSQRHIAFCAYGTGPAKWLGALREQWSRQ